MSHIGLTEILIVVALILLFFGGKKLPEFTRGLGDAVREFKKASGSDKKGDKTKEEE